MTLVEFLSKHGLSETPRISFHAKTRFIQRFHGMPRSRISKHIRSLLESAELVDDDGKTQAWIHRDSGLKIVTSIGERRGVSRLFVVTVYHVSGEYSAT